MDDNQKPKDQNTNRTSFSSDELFDTTKKPVRSESDQTANRPARPQGYSSYQPRPPRPAGEQGSYQPRTDRPQGDRPQRPYSDRPQGQGYQPRPQGDRPPRPYGDRPQGQGYQPRPQGDRPPRPYGDRPQGQGYQPRPQGDRPQRPYGDRPQGQGYQPRPQGDRPQRPYGDRPQGQGYQPRPQGDRPQRPYGDRPQGQGYQQRPQGQGGYQQRPQGQGGYQQRPQGQGANRPFNKPQGSSDSQSSNKPASTRTTNKKPVNQKNFYKPKNAETDLNQKTNKKKDNKKVAAPEVIVTKLSYQVGMQLNEIAAQLNRSSAEILKILMGLGYFINLNTSIDKEQAEMLCEALEIEFELEKLTDLTRFDEFEEEDDSEKMVSRPPIVTIMGHVDHGKTTLLDFIRNTRITKSEVGGITQSIGAYQVDTKDGRKITFIDTPGHAAFSEMRARGAQITDICILVVAADDGVMPQTKEAIKQAREAEVPIIVCVNKMDKPGANPERVMTELTNFDEKLTPEEWGGKTTYCQISALQGTGVDNLLEMVLLTADMNDIKANPEAVATGVVIEAKTDKGKGNLATIIVKNGTLNVGDNLIIGSIYCKIRTMTDDCGRRLKSALPSQAVEITGLEGSPYAGDKFRYFKDEREAKNIASKRSHTAWMEELAHNRTTNIDQVLKDEAMKSLFLIVKSDTQGTAEALRSELEKLGNEEIKIHLIRCAAGAITEEDINIAYSSKAIVIGFNTKPTLSVKETARAKKVDIRFYNIIFNLIDDVQEMVSKMRKPIFEDIKTGTALVQKLFTISRLGTIAGCLVTDGTIERISKVIVKRKDKVIFEGKMSSLKHLKDEVKTVKNGFECGIMAEGFNDFNVDDTIDCYIEKEVVRK